MKSKRQKIYNLFILLAALVMVSCVKEEKYVLKGDIENLKGTEVYLQILADTGFKIIDTAIISDYKFEFRGKTEEPKTVTLFFKNQVGNTEILCSSFYLENSTIQLKGNINDRKNIVISGTIEDGVTKKINKAINFPKRYYDIHNAFFRNSKVAQIPDTIKKWTRELILIDSLHKQKLLKIVKEYPDSYSAMHIVLNNINYLTIADLKGIRDNIGTGLRNSTSFKKIETIINNNPQVELGNTFKNFELEDSNGNKFKLANHKSKFILIDIWASWCAPCRKQIPALKEIYSKYNKENIFEIIAISVDENKLAWHNALDIEKMPWKNLNNSEKDWAKNNYLITSIPANFLLDENKTIIGKNLSEQEIEHFLKSDNKRLIRE